MQLRQAGNAWRPGSPAAAALALFALGFAVAASPADAAVLQQTDAAAKPPAENADTIVQSQPTEGADQPGPVDRVAALAPPSSGQHSSGPFPIDWEHLRFLRGANGRVTVWAAINVDAGRCQPKHAPGGWLYSLALRYELFDKDGERVAIGSDSLLYVHPQRLRSDQGFGLQAAVNVAPGTYRFRIEVQDRNRDPIASSIKEGELIVPSYEVPGPVLSDLAIASDTPGIWQPLPGIRLKLNAAHVVHVDASPYIYFEAYGLTPGARYRVQVQMESAETRSFMDRRIRGSSRPFQLQYSGPVPTDPDAPVRGAQHLKLGHNTDPGRYLVTVRITDLSTGETSLPRRVNLQVRSRGFDVNEPSARLGSGAG